MNPGSTDPSVMPKPDPLGPVFAMRDPRDVAHAFACLVAEWLDRDCALAVEGREGSGLVERIPPPGRELVPEMAWLDKAALQALEGINPEVAGPADRQVFAMQLRRGNNACAAIAIELRGGEVRMDEQALLEMLVTAISQKLGRDRALEAAEAREKDHDRWFKTVDMQLRVLDRERQKFRAVVNRGDASVMVMDREGRVVWVNSEMMRTHGEKRDPHSLHGKSCQEMCGREGPPCADCPVHRVLAGATIAHQERRRELGGTVRDLYATALPIRAPEGQVDEVLVTLQDLTDLEILRRSEARYRQLFEGSADAMLMVEPHEFRVLRSNKTAQEMLGYTSADLTGRSLHELHPDYEMERILPHYRALIEGRQAGGVDGEVYTSSGERLLCNVHGALFDLDGIQVLMVELRDVTTVRRLERELAQADRLASLGTMSAGIAHEFKNRLAPLKGLVQLVSMHTGEPERTAEYSRLLLQEVDRLAALVRGVLDFARPQAALPFAHDLGHLTHACGSEFMQEFEAELAERGVGVELAGEPTELMPVSLDAEQVRRVFQNLLKNAMEACAAGGQIRLRAFARAGRGIVVIEDTGCGMNPTAITRIFDPFFSTKGSGGTGLGMCIVKSLVQSNGGRLELRSRPGQGTCVELTFDLLQGETRSEKVA